MRVSAKCIVDNHYSCHCVKHMEGPWTSLIVIQCTMSQVHGVSPVVDCSDNFRVPLTIVRFTFYLDVKQTMLPICLAALVTENFMYTDCTVEGKVDPYIRFVSCYPVPC